MSNLDLSYMHGKSRLLESESDRLQREVDNFTHKLEQQRRRNASLDEQVGHMSKEVRAKKDELQAKLPSVKEERRLEVKIRTLESNLQQEMVKLNDMQSKNKELREKINVLRREKQAYLEMFDNMEQELIDKAREAEKCNKEHLESSKAEEKYKLKMLKLKAKAEDEIAQLQSQFTAMQSVIEEDRKKQNAAVKEIANTLTSPDGKGNSEDAVDPHTVLEALYNKWSSACKERKRVVDQYHKNIRILSDAFNQIREATGIDDIDEMVTAFIKSEEQHYALYSYVNSLNTELDGLEERYQYLSKHYEQLRNILDQEKSSNIAVATELNDQIRQLNEEKQSTQEEIQSLKDEISSIQEPVEEMIKEFEECNFTLEFNKKLTRDEGFLVNEQNVEQYLGELEEYLSSLITHLAYENGKKGAALSAILADDLPSKTDKEVPKFLSELLQADNIVEDVETEENVPLTIKDFQAKSKEIYLARQINNDPSKTS
ncbi:unnamed protein product [Blepharisma stoltei]|uniref:ODAD1 central coiled coil region domain-containing protein n=1 Tax=Blepharisma stoltei TaxID=1481888 RepID=A0AAU9K2L1_9CILI|nr:unnamed protein product [Blepharisma stoltei]